VAFAEHDSVKLHYESTGAGAPVLLVMGLGLSATGWWRTIPVLAESLRVIAFDNRGVGRSDRPPGPYSVPEMADDAAAVLDAAEEESAHVYGISLGGMIAQEIALRHPDRVRSLVLGCTTSGGQGAVPISDSTAEFFRRRTTMPAAEAVWASVPYSYGEETRLRGGQLIAEDIAQRLRFPIEPEPYAAQLEAALGFARFDSLGDIGKPTLVLHGDEDQIVPVENGRILAEHIDGAELEVLPGAGHLYPTDAPHATRRALGFLSERSSPGPS
jgi:pimeloyl-ACP methyl ester carboxylesterase